MTRPYDAAALERDMAVILALVHQAKLTPIGKTRLHAARMRMARELGRRYGWTGHHPVATGAQRLHGTHLQPGEFDRMPGAQNGSYFTKAGCVVALVEQPVFKPWTMDVAREWAASRGLFVELPDYPSWWWPDRTRVILITRADVQPSAVFQSAELQQPQSDARNA